MRIINISASAKNHLSDNFNEFMEQINSAAIVVVEPLSAYGFVQNGVEHVYIDCAEELSFNAGDSMQVFMSGKWHDCEFIANGYGRHYGVFYIMPDGGIYNSYDRPIIKVER